MSFAKSPSHASAVQKHPLSPSNGANKSQDKTSRTYILPDRPTFTRQKSCDKWREPERPSFSSLGKWFRSRTLSMESLKMFTPKKPLLLRQASVDIQVEINKKEFKSWPNRISPLKKSEPRVNESLKTKNKSLTITKPNPGLSSTSPSPLIKTPVDIRSEKVEEINKELEELSKERQSILDDMIKIIELQKIEGKIKDERYLVAESLVTCMRNMHNITSNLKMISKTKAKIATKDIREITNQNVQNLQKILQLIEKKESTDETRKPTEDIAHVAEKTPSQSSTLRRTGSGNNNNNNNHEIVNLKISQKRHSLPLELGDKFLSAKLEWLNCASGQPNPIETRDIQKCRSSRVDSISDDADIIADDIVKKNRISRADAISDDADIIADDIVKTNRISRADSMTVDVDKVDMSSTQKLLRDEEALAGGSAAEKLSNSMVDSGANGVDESSSISRGLSREILPEQSEIKASSMSQNLMVKLEKDEEDATELTPPRQFITHSITLELGETKTPPMCEIKSTEISPKQIKPQLTTISQNKSPVFTPERSDVKLASISQISSNDISLEQIASNTQGREETSPLIQSSPDSLPSGQLSQSCDSQIEAKSLPITLILSKKSDSEPKGQSFESESYSSSLSSTVHREKCIRDSSIVTTELALSPKNITQEISREQNKTNAACSPPALSTEQNQSTTVGSSRDVSPEKRPISICGDIAHIEETIGKSGGNANEQNSANAVGKSLVVLPVRTETTGNHKNVEAKISAEPNKPGLASNEPIISLEPKTTDLEDNEPTLSAKSNEPGLSSTSSAETKKLEDIEPTISPQPNEPRFENEPMSPAESKILNVKDEEPMPSAESNKPGLEENKPGEDAGSNPDDVDTIVQSFDVIHGAFNFYDEDIQFI